MNLSLLNNFNFNPTTILDIGAHLGDFTYQCKNLWPNVYVFMIEANKNCEQFLKRFNSDYLITLLGDQNKLITYYTQSDNDWGAGNSIYKELTEIKYNETELEMKRLDDLFESDSQFDLIKIDVQGAEIDVMNGGHNLIKKAKYVILELSIEPYNKNAPLYKDVINYMLNLNFIPRIELEEHYLNKKLIQVDIAFYNLSYEQQLPK